MKIKGAGCLVVNPKDQILLVHRPKYNDWSFPKGKIDKDELFPVAAIRETEEETGQKVVLNKLVKTISYDDKVVRYYSANLVDRDEKFLKVRFPVKKASKTEIDDAQWFSIEDALNVMTYRLDKDVLETILIKKDDVRKFNLDYFKPELLKIPACQPVSKKKWFGDKKERPLSGDGLKESVQIEQLLSAYGIQDLIITKDRQYFRQTVAKYADELDINIKLDKHFLSENTLEFNRRTAVVINKE